MSDEEIKFGSETMHEKHEIGFISYPRRVLATTKFGAE